MAAPWANDPIATDANVPPVAAQPQLINGLAPGYSIKPDPTPTIYDREGKMVAERDALPNVMAIAERWARDKQRAPEVRSQNLNSLNRYRDAIGLPPISMRDLEGTGPVTPEQQVITAQPQPSAQPNQPPITPAPAPRVAQDASRFAVPQVTPVASAQNGPLPAPWANDPIAPSMNWSDVPGQALKNAPKSAADFVGSIAHAVMHPIDTVSSIADAAAGGLRAGAKAVLPDAAFNAIDSLDTPETRQRMDDTAGAVGKMIMDRYGSVDAFKKTLATDPVGAAADISMVLTGGGSAAARAPGMVGQAGRAVATAGSYLDPLQATGRAVAATGRGAAEVLGSTTGAGARPFREAYQAGQTANPAFTQNMRGQVPVGNVVDMAENAVNQMGRERSAAYNADMATTRASTTPIDLAPVRQALDQTLDMVRYQSPSGQTIITSPAAAAVHTQVTNLLNEFMTLTPAERTPAAFDALKRGVGAIREGTQQGTTERAVAQQLYNTVRDEIVAQVPDYAHAMQGYGAASDAITEQRRTMSINDRAMPDTTLRKLQSTMRNNVNTNYGAREALLDQLAHFQPNLPAALGGQSLNSLAPRGLARLGVLGALQGGAAMMNPMTLATLPLTSPRIMGELTYGAGRATGAVQNALQAAHLPPEVLRNALMAAYVGDTPSRAQNRLQGGR